MQKKLEKQNKAAEKSSTESIFINNMRTFIKRPAMFEINRVEDMFLITFGYLYGLSGENKEIIFDFMSNFRKFVNNYFNSDQDSSWHRLIRFNVGNNDRESILLFTNLFEKYLEKINRA